ncbi:hypothetical protein M8C21_009907, partial [Ambrosia artemisiifolia]
KKERRFSGLTHPPPMLIVYISFKRRDKVLDWLFSNKLVSCLKFELEVLFANAKSPRYYHMRTYTTWKLTLFGCTVTVEPPECKEYPNEWICIFIFDILQVVYWFHHFQTRWIGICKQWV